MKFQKGTRRRALEYEKDLVQYWKDNKTFEKSVENRPADNAYVFYDGPPFITGVPHHGTLLSSIAKDVVPRYWTMKGKRVERRWGWDCHGLPAEVFTEKKLGIHDRRDIGTKISLEEYILTCRENMVQTGDLWETTIDRIGRWVDFRGAYKTMDKDFMESVWWAFKELYDKGKIYEGERVLLYCTRDATPISKAEVAMDNSYQDVTDPSVYVKFPLVDKAETTYILCGGNDRKYDEFGKKLAEEITRTTPEPRILDVFFMRPENVWQEIFDDWKRFYDQHFNNYSRELAQLDTFYEQAATADVIFFHGGKTELLRSKLPDYQKVEQALKGKIYVGSSAGANYIAKHALSHNGVTENSGILPINVVVHYESGNPEEVRSTERANELEAKYPAEKTLRLREGQFEVIKSPKTYLLAWTTTPWTLNANTAIGVGENETYAEVKMEDGTHLILLDNLTAKVLTDEKHNALNYEVVRADIKGSELVGLEYEPLFGVHRGANAHKVWNYPGLSTEEGTGIVHLAPAYGEEDYALSKEKGFPFVIDIDDSGFYNEGNWKGQYVWDANKPIAKELHEQGVVFKIDYIKHSYPHCHRCGTKLMYRAHPSWFMDIAGNKPLMLEQNENINWFPEHLKYGRFAKTIESAPDWNMSRDRFWATAMPVWKGVDGQGNSRDADGNEYIKVVGSYAELKELSGEELLDYHRPWIDDIEFDLDGVHYRRIDKVLDCWFESGSMPFAQFHYPFENREKFEQNFPGDFIVEYVGQVRAWFYYVHAVNTALFGKNAYKNVITTGTLAGNDGRKMSKSFGNYTDPNELMDQYSADSLRFLLMSSPVMAAEDYSLQDKDVADVARKLSMVWNMYDFFTLYADVDQWESPEDPYRDPLEDLSNPLDRWIVSRVHQLTEEVATNMDKYDVPSAAKPILPFLDDASNWYVRRSRRRFWKSEDDNDKNDAYRTLHYVLVRLSHVMAPFTPFLAEELYRKLTGGESVHLRDWPETGAVDETVINEMKFVREAINDGLSKRAEAKIKVRQPLASAKVINMVSSTTDSGLSAELLEIVKDELNVKSVSVSTASESGGGPSAFVELNTEITSELRREGLMREVIRQVQNARKQAGLNVDDRIHLALDTHDDELGQAIAEHAETIRLETLAESLNTEGGTTAEGYAADVKVETAALAVALRKA